MDERGEDVSAKQRLYLFNSGDIHRKLGRLAMPPRKLACGDVNPYYKMTASKRLEEIYWSILSRPPSEYERRVVNSLWKRRGGGNRKSRASYGELMRDVAWCPVNTKEFLFRI
jgi:hypothetical protein